MSDVGTNLQRLRRDRSQTWLADEMRTKGWRWSQPTVSAIEKGERSIQLAEAVDLVDVLGLSSLDELVTVSLSGDAPPITNLDDALAIVTEIDRLRAVLREVKSAFALSELDGGVKAAPAHPLHEEASRRVRALHERLLELL